MSAIVAELYDALRKAGVDEDLAKSAARAVLAAEARADLATKGDLAELKAATTADIAALKTELKADIAALKAEVKADMAALRAELKGDISQLRTDMAEMKADLIKWNVGAMAVLTGIFAAIVRLA